MFKNVWGIYRSICSTKTICAPHEENSSTEKQKNPPPCHTNVPMIYTKHINCKCIHDK